MKRGRELSRETRLRATLLGLGLGFAFIACWPSGDLSPAMMMGGFITAFIFLSHAMELSNGLLQRGVLVVTEVVILGLLSAVIGKQAVGLFLGTAGAALASLQYGTNTGVMYAVLLAAAQIAVYLGHGMPSQAQWPEVFLRLTLPIWAAHLGNVGFTGGEVVVSASHMGNQKQLLDKAQSAARQEMEARLKREQELFDERRKLEALRDIAHRIGVLRSPDELLATIVQSAKEQMQVNTALVMLVRDENLVVEWKDGMSDLGAQYLMGKVGHGVFGQLVMSGQSLRFTHSDGYAVLRSLRDVGALPHLLVGGRRNEGAGPVARQDEIRNLLAVPLRTPQDKIPFGLLILANRVMGDFSEHDQGFLEILATDAAIAIRNLFFMNQLEQSFDEMILALAQAIEAKDPYTKDHVSRVEKYSVKIARAMGLPAEFIHDIHVAAILHDVGKISTPDHILMKPGALTDEEFEIMKQHASNSVHILRDIRSVSPSIQKMVLHHHERWDGKGYPSALKGNDIPLGAQIIAVADCFDAMTSDRPYRKGFTSAEALKRMEQGAGSQFNSEILAYFLALWNYEPKASESLAELTRRAREKVGANLMRSPEPSETRRAQGAVAAAPAALAAGPSAPPKRLELEL